MLNQLKAEGKAPEWMTEQGYQTLSKGYLLPNETPLGMYLRVAKAAGSYYSNSDFWASQFFTAMWNNWLCPATPILCNMGTDRGLPISCNSLHVGDSVDSIFRKSHELAVLSKQGAGVGIYLGDIRGRGVGIKNNGTSEGIVPWAKLYDITVSAVSQGSTRRGAAAIYLPIEHLDIEEFINIRRPTGDVNRRCHNLHHAVSITDSWMEEMLAGDKEKRNLWKEILRSRVETGEPYLMFIDTVNNQNPECYKANNLHVSTSNICSEITLHTDTSHTFVCCLSSLNLSRWDEWKDTNLPQIAVRFLDAVIEEYIKKGEHIAGLEPAINSAKAGRAIGIGVLGWHTLLQEKKLPFDSFGSMMLNAQIFNTIRTKAEEETKLLATELGEPEWCLGFGRRNTHLMAIAPTVSNSVISGNVSAGIEPIMANIYVDKTAKGVFIQENPVLKRLLENLNMWTPEIIKSINEYGGSVQHLEGLSAEEKEVFLTAREINQFAIIKQAAQRQQFIDQGQSVNLFFTSSSDPKYIHEVHIEAWKQKLKTLYYFRSTGALKGDLASRSKEECAACEG